MQLSIKHAVIVFLFLGFSNLTHGSDPEHYEDHACFSLPVSDRLFSLRLADHLLSRAQELAAGARDDEDSVAIIHRWEGSKAMIVAARLLSEAKLPEGVGKSNYKRAIAEDMYPNLLHQIATTKLYIDVEFGGTGVERGESARRLRADIGPQISQVRKAVQATIASAIRSNETGQKEGL